MTNDDIVKNLFKKRETTKQQDNAIIQALKDNRVLKVTNGDKWMQWELGQWVVLHRKWNSKKTKVLISTTSETDAINMLLRGE